MNCIEIINQNFELLGIITDFESLIYVRNFYECGTFELTINKSKANTSKLQKGNMLIVNKRDNKILLIEKVITTTEQNGNKTLKVSGDCIKGITKRRIIATNGYDRTEYTNAENVQKHYLRNHIIESYYDDIRTPERDISWLEIAPSQDRGIKTVWQARLTNLHEEMKHISEDTGLGWEGRLNRSKKKIVFDSIKGHDRTIHQAINPRYASKTITIYT